MLVTLVEGDPKAPSFLPSIPRFTGGCYTLDLYFVMLSTKEVLSTIFSVFGMIWPENEPWSLSLLVDTLPTTKIREMICTDYSC